MPDYPSNNMITEHLFVDDLPPQLQKNLASILDMSPLNHTVLDNMRNEMRGRGIDWLLDLYLRELPNYLREIHQAFESDSSEQLYLAAHKFKGGSANLGAHQVVNFCKLFEYLAKQEQLKIANRLVPMLEAAIAQLSVEITEERQNNCSE